MNHATAKQTSSRKRTTLFAFAALCMTAASAIAQPPELEEIVVTANKRAEVITDVSGSVQVYEMEDVLDKGVRDLANLYRITPGLSTYSKFTPSRSSFAFRGVQPTVGHDATTGLYYDGAPMATPGYSFAPTSDIFDLERIEVLKGPQGTLYGQGSMGGTIRVITNDADPSGGFHGKVQGTTYLTKDGDETWGGDVAVNLPIVEDKLAVRLVYSKLDVGGFIDDDTGVQGDDINPKEYTTIRGKVTFKPIDRLTLRFSYWDSELDDVFGNTTDGDDPTDLNRYFDGGLATTYGYEFDNASGFASYDFDFATLEYIGSTADMAIPLTFANGAIQVFAYGDSTYETSSHELRLVSSGDSPLKWVGGIFYNEAEGAQPLEIHVGVPGLGLITLGNNAQLFDTSSISFFGEVSYDFGKWELLFGARYFEDDRDINSLVDPIEGFGLLSDQVSNPAIDPTSAVDETFDTFTPRFNVKYRFDNENILYANVGKGFRSGFLQYPVVADNLNAAGFEGNFAVIDPDELWSFEVGSKGFLANDTLQYEAAAYFIDWDNAVHQVIPDPVVFPVGILANIGDVEIIGVEFGFTYFTEIDGLTLGFYGNLMDSDVTLSDTFGGSAAFDTTTYGKFGNNKLPGLVHEQLNFDIDYARSLASGLELTVNASAVYSSSTFAADGPLERTLPVSGEIVSTETDNYVIANVNVGIGLNNWKATLFVHNLFNEIAINGISNGNLVGLSIPRRIGLRLALEF